MSYRTRLLRRFAPTRPLHVEKLEDRCLLAALVMSANEQLLIELINRARANPAAEAARLGIGLNSGVCDGAAPNISATPKQPLAPHQALINAAGDHAEDMLARDYFDHTTLGTNRGPSDRARSAGYPGGAGENISTYRQWPNDFTAVERVDQVYDRHRSLFESTCHRINMFREQWEDIGTGIRFGDYTSSGRVWKASMVVENFGSAVGGQITGVVFDETKFNDTRHEDAGIYNVGEGVGGVTITVTNAAGAVVASEQSGASGGYSLSVPPGVGYTVTASGGPLNAPWVVRNVSHGQGAFTNTKLDFELSQAPAVNIEPDNMGVYDVSARRFYLDANGNGRLDTTNGDLVVSGFANVGDMPLAGDWNGDGKDEIGLFRPRNRLFYLDVNGNGAWNGLNGDERRGSFGNVGDQGIVGDWNGDGRDDIGVFRPRGNWFYLDMNGNGLWDGLNVDRRVGGFGNVGDRPLVGDWNGDGKDEIGLFRPNGNWFYLDLNANGAWNGIASDRRQGPFGNAGDKPVVGDWDGDGDTQIGAYDSPIFRLDRSGNGLFGTGDSSHTYFGVSTDIPLAGNWALSLQAASGIESDGGNRNPITTESLTPLVAQATALWSGVDLNASQRTALESVQFRVGDLSGGELGMAGGSVVTLDENAAGYGWFVDLSPTASEEYALRGDGALAAWKGSAAEGRMDLLSVVLHELGHLLGYGHNDEDMLETLAVGVRRLPSAVDAVFADAGL